MKLLYQRDYSDPLTTSGKTYINGRPFGFALENTQTKIPAGTYRIVNTKSPLLKRVTPEIMDVPGRYGIRLHRGNYWPDSIGCPLVAARRLKWDYIQQQQEDTLRGLLNHSGPHYITIEDKVTNTGKGTNYFPEWEKSNAKNAKKLNGHGAKVNRAISKKFAAGTIGMGTIILIGIGIYLYSQHRKKAGKK